MSKEKEYLTDNLTKLLKRLDKQKELKKNLNSNSDMHKKLDEQILKLKSECEIINDIMIKLTNSI